MAKKPTKAQLLARFGGKKAAPFGSKKAPAKGKLKRSK